MSRLFSGMVTVIGALILVAYPFIIYFGLNHFNQQSIALFLIAIFSLRLLFFKGKIMMLVVVMRSVLFIAICLFILSFIFKGEGWFLFYPVMVNAVLGVTFGYSLIKPPSMIERFARLVEPNLPEAGIRYTRQVTKVWIVFFILNGSIALYTAFLNNLQWWTLYNGAISYGLIGSLFLGEWIVRQWTLRQQ